MKHLPSIKHLQYLDALATTGHFGKAAAACHVTPSTLSAGIRELEAVLGAPVAERSKRHVLLLPVGLELAASARQIISEAESMVRRARSGSGLLTGEIRLGIIPTIAPYLLPQVLPGVRNTYPDARLLLREDQTDPLLSRLNDGQLDAAVIALPYKIDGLAHQTMFTDPFLFACHKTHPLASRKSIRDSELADEPLLLLEQGHCLRGHALDACQLAGSAFKSTFEATSLATLVQMVASGIGVTLLPQLLVDAGGLAGLDIKAIAITGGSAQRTIALVWRATTHWPDDFKALAAALTPAG